MKDLRDLYGWAEGDYKLGYYGGSMSGAAARTGNLIKKQK